MGKLRYVLLTLLLILSVPAFAGMGIGAFIDPALLSYDDINPTTLERESYTRPSALVGVQLVKPLISATFVSIKAGAGFTLPVTQNGTDELGASRAVKSRMSFFRATAHFNFLFDNGVYLFAGGGYESNRLRFAGDIPELSADSKFTIVEAGIGRMLNDLNFINISVSIAPDLNALSLGYTHFFYYSGY